MLKPYDELRRIDVRPYCEQRDGYLYLNWAKCIDLLHEHGASEVYFDTVQNPITGGSLYESATTFEDKKGNKNKCYETRIKVVVDQNVWYMQSPVMNGTNPVKDNSMSQQRVWNSMTRSFVKCIAIHTGLGFDLWLKEEMRAAEKPPIVTDAKAKLKDIVFIKKQCEEMNLNFKAWIAQIGCTENTLTELDVGKMLRAINAKKAEREAENAAALEKRADV